MSRSLAALAAVLAVTTGCITGPPHYDDHDLYVGVGANLGIERFDLDTRIDADDSAGAGLSVGYRVNPRLAAELDLDFFNEYQADIGGTQTADLEQIILTANAKGYLHTGNIQPYGIVGVGVMKGDTVDAVGATLDRDTELAITLRGGVGLEVHDVLHGFVHHAPVFMYADLSYWLPTGDLSDYNFIQATVGFAWKFGGHGHGEERGDGDAEH